MFENPPAPQKISPKTEPSSHILKLLIIGAMLIVLLIPLFMIGSLVDERQARKSKVLSEVMMKWGKSQVVGGPILSIPVKTSVTQEPSPDPQKPQVSDYRPTYLHISPDEMRVDVALTSTPMKRGVFRTMGYNAVVDMVGTFILPGDQPDVQSGNLLMDRALLSACLGDPRGLKEIKVEVDGTPLNVDRSPGLAGMPVTDSEDKDGREVTYNFTARYPLADPGVKHSFHLRLKLTGSERIGFLASAMRESLVVRGDWPSPSFTGTTLPDQRNVTGSGFSAAWTQHHLGSGVKRAWLSVEGNPSVAEMGTDLVIPVQSYQMTSRVVKYGVLFILLLFMTFFFAEILSRERIHPVQYLMVGSAAVVFYLLLLSLSERLPFGWAYLIASGSVVLQVSLYAASVLPSRRFPVLIGTLLSVLYGYFYVLLQLEDTALLVGSVGLFVLLSVAMVLVRKVKWYPAE